MKHCDTVRCLAGSIDSKSGKGAIGIVEAFGRFSKYHPREVYVFFEDKPLQSGWFWERDVEVLETAKAA